MRCGLALGSITISWWCYYKSNVDSTAKNRAFKLCSYFTFTWVWTGLCFCMCCFFFYYLHLLYKSGKHWANTHWIKFPKQQVVGVGFPLYSTNLFHYCFTVTWHTRGPLWFKHLYPQPVIHPWAVGCKGIADKPNCVLIDHQVKLNVALLPLSEKFTWSFLYPSVADVLCVLHTKSAFHTSFYGGDRVQHLRYKTRKYLVQGHFNTLAAGWMSQTSYLFIYPTVSLNNRRTPWTEAD